MSGLEICLAIMGMAVFLAIGVMLWGLGKEG